MDVPGASISPARLNGPSCHYAHSWPLVPTRTSMAPRVTTHVPGPMHARLWRVVPARISPACTHCPLILARTSLALWRLDPARMFPECTHSTSVPPLLSSSTHEPGLWVQHAGPWSLTLPLVSAGCQCAASSQRARAWSLGSARRSLEPHLAPRVGRLPVCGLVSARTRPRPLLLV